MKVEKEKKGKKAYEKPRLRTIELAAEEVLAIHCKRTVNASGSGGNCQNAPCRHGLGS